MEKEFLKDLFCHQCQLQFNGKAVYNLHLFMFMNMILTIKLRKIREKVLLNVTSVMKNL